MQPIIGYIKLKIGNVLLKMKGLFKDIKQWILWLKDLVVNNNKQYLECYGKGQDIEREASVTKPARIKFIKENI